MWCGVIGDQLTGPYILRQRLTGDIYANFLQHELPALLQKVPLRTRRQLYYQRAEHPSFRPDRQAVSESAVF